MIATVRNIAAKKACESPLVEKKERRDGERVLVFVTNHLLIFSPPVLKCGVQPPAGPRSLSCPRDGDRVWPKGSRCRYVIWTNLNCSESLGRRSHRARRAGRPPGPSVRRYRGYRLVTAWLPGGGEHGANVVPNS